MRFTPRSIVAAVLVVAAACSRSRSLSSVPTGSTVVLDGRFDEWTAFAPVASRAPGGSVGSDADLVAVRQRSDGRFVYLEVDLARPINLLGFQGTLSLEVNADGDDGTGTTIDGLAGADFAIDFDPRNADGRLTEGAYVRVAGRDGRIRTTDTYPLEFVQQPTYEASRFEMRMARGRRFADSLQTVPSFTGREYRAQLVVRDPAGAIANRLPAFSAPLPPVDTSNADATRDPLARAPETQFRALVWNMANENFVARPERFTKVIAAVDPDLLILDEVAGVLGHDSLGVLLQSIPVTRGRWNFTYGGGGGYQRTVIAARTAVAEFPDFAMIRFPESEVATWFSAIPEARRARERAGLDSGVATGGAVVTIAGRRVAVFGVDLQSAGNRRTSWQEQRRWAEARIIRDHAVAAIRAHGPVDGVIEAGDHNLVGTREPLDILAQIGNAFDGRPLAHPDLLQLDGRTAATWEGTTGGQFPPGRLDWFGYTESSLQVLGGFVFDAADLSARWRAAHGLVIEDSRRSSDHRPLVVDLRWKR